MKYKLSQYIDSHSTLYVKAIEKDELDQHAGLKFVGVSRIDMPVFFDLLDGEIISETVTRGMTRFHLNSQPPASVVAAQCHRVKFHAYPRDKEKVGDTTNAGP
jgi:hypothetical protein